MKTESEAPIGQSCPWLPLVFFARCSLPRPVSSIGPFFFPTPVSCIRSALSSFIPFTAEGVDLPDPSDVIAKGVA